MWLKVTVLLLAAAYVGYRVLLAVEIARARRVGDRARVETLRTRGFGLHRWALALLALAILFLLLLVLTNRT